MHRQVNIFNSLAIAALTLMIIDPNYLFDVGFQLSFTAVIGIVWIFPLLNKYWQPKKRIVKYIWGLVLVSVAAQIATFPITMFYFHKFSGLFLVANLIEIPLISALLIISYFIITLFVLNIDNKIFDLVYDKTVNLIEYVSLKISSFECVIFDGLFINELTVILLFFIVVLIIFLVQHKRTEFLIAIFLVVITLQISKFYKLSNMLKTQKLMIAKKEIFIQNGSEYSTNQIGTAKLFSNYAIANNLKLEENSINSIFFFNKIVFLKVEELFDTNPILENHFLIIDNNINLSPKLLITSNTKGVIFTDYKSINKKRWEYYCIKKNIPFFNTTKNLFQIERTIF
jgi:competence protein ComEC